MNISGIVLGITSGLSLSFMTLIRKNTQLQSLDADILALWDILISSIPSVVSIFFININTGIE